MSNVVLTIEYDNGKSKDLALPLDVSCRVLASALAKALKLESEMEEAFVLVDMSVAGGRALSQNLTLADAGIVHGRVLKLATESLREARPIPQGGGQLVTSEGQRLLLNGAYTLIGRRDLKHNILPDLDLTDLDVEKAASRKHAVIEYSKKEWIITDQGSSNGTWVNEERIVSNVQKQLNDGDEIVFGRNGVRVNFKRG